MATATEANQPPKAGNKTGWKKRQVHEGITLPSGQVVDIRIPSLPQLVKSGQIPNNLVEVALQQQGQAQEDKKITKENLEETWEFTEFVIPWMVVNPKIEKEDVNDLPNLDLEKLIAFAQRITDMDAVGHQLGGLETQAAFRDFRGLLTTDEILGGGE